MSEARFEQFLASSFIAWAQDNVVNGYRYQFQSPNVNSSSNLYRSLVSPEFASGVLQVRDVDLAYIQCGSVRLIPVIQRGSNEVGYTENFISFLRDEVAAQKADFSSTALLVIHNSLLDTLINSAEDLSADGSAFDTRTIRGTLENFIDESSNEDSKELSRILLDYQFDLISEDGGSMFGFESLYLAIADGEIRFEEIGLLNDPAVIGMKENKKQIRARLDENRRLYDKISDVLEHYPDQLEEYLPDLSEGFIDKYFRSGEEDDWKIPTFDEYGREQSRNKEKNLELVSESSVTGRILVRTKSNSKAAQRERHVLLEVDESSDEFDLQIEFVGDRVLQSELNVVDAENFITVDENVQLRGGSRNTSLLVTGAAREEPRFFSLDLKRAKTSERYKFKCLVIKRGFFCIEAIENSFLVNPGKKPSVPLQMQETAIVISQDGESDLIELTENDQAFDVASAKALDFTKLSNEQDRIQFTVQSGSAKLKFELEGAAPTDNVVLPLIFDQSRGARLFSDGLNGVFNRSKRKVYIENKEVKADSSVLAYLDHEAYLIDQGLVYANKDSGESLSITYLSSLSPPLAEAYQDLYNYYSSTKTLPSLCGWGPAYLEIVSNLVSVYESFLEGIPDKSSLGAEHRQILKAGFFHNDGKEYVSSIHCLGLAYFRYLVDRASDNNSESFRSLPKVTLSRLNHQGLLPFLFHSDYGYSYTKAEPTNVFWMHCVPQVESNYSYVSRLVRDKVTEFVEAFDVLFDAPTSQNGGPTLIINSVNNDLNREVFEGLVALVAKNHRKMFNIHVNLYDDAFSLTEFDRFAEMANYEQIKQHYGLNKGNLKDHSDTIVDLLRTRVTYSKFKHSDCEEQQYAHLSFYRNKEKIKVVNVNPEEKLSGLACHGLLSGEASASEQGNYITGFGLANVDQENLSHLNIAKLIGRLMHPARESTMEYRDNSAIALAVSEQFRDQLKCSYESAIWTSIIDPKVTLDFFTDEDGLLLIHYSDQYTSSASYDAITVTQKKELYDKVLAKGDGGLVREFNAFNGEWLLKMITDPAKLRKERTGILAAYKLVSILLAGSDITWVPMSVAEMIRVSGNIGLKMSESEFSRHLQGYSQGAISDDVLFVGFKDERLYLLPLEVKTGASYDSTKAVKQASELLRYLSEQMLSGNGLDKALYRSLFVQEVLMQVDKYKLYKVQTEEYFDPLLEKREWWLQGDYSLASLDAYPDGFVVANLEDERCLETRVEEVEGILKIEVPSSFISRTISTPLLDLIDNPETTAVARVPERYFLAKDQHSSIMDGIQAGEIQSEEGTVSEPVDNLEKTPQTDEHETETSVAPFDQKESVPLKVLVGHEVNHGEAVYWEPTNTAKFMNTNSGIIGTMGTGKTQCTKSVVTQLHRNQHCNVDGKPIGMLIFDYKSDYVDDKFIDATEAKKYNLHKLPYNPLSLFGDTPMLPVHTARGFSETMGKAFGLGQKQQLKLRKLIGDAYELAGISKSDRSSWTKPAPTIADVWALFIDQDKVEEDSLYAALESLYELEVFEDDVSKCTSLYELIDGIRVIELAGYPSQIQNLVVALTLDLFYSQMQKKGKPTVNGDFRQVTKLLLVDEADNFMSQDFPSLRKILKEGREYGVGVILSTQDITHFKTKENDYSAYILSWVVHRVSQIKNQDIKSIFNKDDRSDQDYLMNTIRELEKHHSLYVDGDKRVTKIKDKAFWEISNEL